MDVYIVAEKGQPPTLVYTQHANISVHLDGNQREGET